MLTPTISSPLAVPTPVSYMGASNDNVLFCGPGIFLVNRHPSTPGTPPGGTITAAPPASQRLQYPLIVEYSLNYSRISNDLNEYSLLK